MSADDITPSEKIEAPQRRNLLISAIVASFIVFLIVGVIRMYLVGGPTWQVRFVWGVVVGIVYWATTFPFALLTIFVYRLIGLPSRYELLTAILVVGTGAVLHVLFF
jgi:hypothetical protein